MLMYITFWQYKSKFMWQQVDDRFFFFLLQQLETRKPYKTRKKLCIQVKRIIINSFNKVCVQYLWLVSAFSSQSLEFGESKTFLIGELKLKVTKMGAKRRAHLSQFKITTTFHTFKVHSSRSKSWIVHFFSIIHQTLAPKRGLCYTVCCWSDVVWWSQ